MLIVLPPILGVIQQNILNNFLKLNKMKKLKGMKNNFSSLENKNFC